LAGILKGG